jgi:hypothetical protein
VVVDDAAALVFGDLAEGDSDAAAVQAGVPSQCPADGDGGASPQLGGVRVPDDLGSVVVAVRA